MRDTAQPGMTAADLAQSDAWRSGWQFLTTGHYWEAHEVFEPVWMVLPPQSPERLLAQAVIQLANAALKARMDRPRAVLRLCDLVQGLLADGGARGCARMGIDPAALQTILDRLRQEAIRAPK